MKECMFENIFPILSIILPTVIAVIAIVINSNKTKNACLYTYRKEIIDVCNVIVDTTLSDLFFNSSKLYYLGLYDKFADSCYILAPNIKRSKEQIEEDRKIHFKYLENKEYIQFLYNSVEDLFENEECYIISTIFKYFLKVCDLYVKEARHENTIDKNNEKYREEIKTFGDNYRNKEIEEEIEYYKNKENEIKIELDKYKRILKEYCEIYKNKYNIKPKL